MKTIATTARRSVLSPRLAADGVLLSRSPTFISAECRAEENFGIRRLPPPDQDKRGPVVRMPIIGGVHHSALSLLECGRTVQGP